MTLRAGVALSHYEVLGPLGAGAMGEVYRARDTRLGREVALKVLPEHFADDDERLLRFEREAKTLAALNHPNVAQIFGVDQVGDTCFLVLELVPGESLAERLARGPLPLDDALDIGAQVAAGLEAAHEAGVIHRDLKPANVRLTPEGKVKVLDFGLAKPAREARGGSTTDSVLSTELGRVLGTPTYMAPEQARGKAIDRRVDVWAFGCVLYECLAGKRAFDGETLTDVLAAVVEREPDWTRLPPATPRHVVELLRRCFAKDPLRRLRDVGEARVALAEPAGASATVYASTSPRRALALGTVAVLAAFALGLVLGRRSATLTSVPPARPIALEVDVPGRALDGGGLALAPDGTQLAFLVEAPGGESELWVRPFAELDARMLAGTQGARHPFWSPDGKELGFFAGHELKRVALAGGAPRTVADVGRAVGGSWNTDGIILCGSENGPLVRVPAGGGKPAPVTEVVRPLEDAHVWPTFLPDGHRFVFLADASSDEGHRLCLGSIDGGAPRVLLTGLRAQPILDPRGAVLVAAGGQLLAYPLDLAAETLASEPIAVAADVFASGFLHGTPVAASLAGVLAYQTGTSAAEVVELGLDGTEQRVLAPADLFNSPALSPDGRRLAIDVTTTDGGREVWVLDLERGVRTLVSQRELHADSSVWSPDGRTLYYDQRRPDGWVVCRRPADGGTEAEDVGAPAGASDVWCNDITRDGRWLLIAANVDSRWGLYLRDLEPGGAWKPWLVGATDVEYARFSPDGRWIAYTTDSSGEVEAYVAPVEGGPGVQRLQISFGGGREPRWSPDGAQLYYRSLAHQLMAVPVRVEDGRLTAGAPEARLRLGGSSRSVFRNSFDLLPDGRGLVLLRVEGQATNRIRVRTSWSW